MNVCYCEHEFKMHGEDERCYVEGCACVQFEECIDETSVEQAAEMSARFFERYGE